MKTKPKQLLPIGIQTFEKLREENCLYVDKTSKIHELISTGTTYFLSRPRRFGKSLLISTLDAIFQGQKELFNGLAISKTDYDWQTYPVVRLDFSSLSRENPEQLEMSLRKRLSRIAEHYHVPLETDGLIADCFQYLVESLAQTNKVVLLVDEYDSPIIEHIGENPEMAKRMRTFLKNFYTVVKSQDQYLKFIFLTGISKFSKVGVFSGLNNLQDITMDGRFADIVGWTQEELEANFQDEIHVLAQREKETKKQTIQKIKKWYNGYRFSDRELNVYNPFSTLLLFSQMIFKFHWFETGTPSFLIRLIREKDYDVQRLKQIEVSETSFSSYEIEQLEVLPLLFQTGYLTIKDYDPQNQLYKLGYPNVEVENAFTEGLIRTFSGMESGLAQGYVVQLIRALRSNDLKAFFDTLRIFFANIPYDIQIEKEKYYQTIFYLIFTLLGLRVEAEVRTSRGRIDAVIELDDTLWLFEFKLTGTAEKALAQIKNRGYYEKYLNRGKALHLVGAVFDPDKHAIGTYLHEMCEQKK